MYQFLIRTTLKEEVSSIFPHIKFKNVSTACKNKYKCCLCQGFGVAAKTTQECRKVDPMSIVVFHQTDVGEFIRNEDTLT